MALYLIPTPLAADTAAMVLPASVLQALGRLDLFFVENLRTARRFIAGLQLGRAIDTLELYELHKDTPAADIAQYAKLLQHREAGVMSEAGCPAIADPGSALVRLAHTAGIRVIPLVGPSSILLALMASGLEGQRFAFHGYLPVKAQERKITIQQLERDSRKYHQTQIFIETPYRNTTLMHDVLMATTSPHTRVCVASNLTAPDEWICTRSIAEWRKQSPLELPRQPTVFLLLGQ